MRFQQVDDGFVAFRAQHETAVFALAMRHCGDQRLAERCVDAVFRHLSDHWSHVRDPVRLMRRAAVLFVRRSRRVVAHRPAHGQRSVTGHHLSSVPIRTPR